MESAMGSIEIPTFIRSWNDSPSHSPTSSHSRTCDSPTYNSFIPSSSTWKEDLPWSTWKEDLPWWKDQELDLDLGCGQVYVQEEKEKASPSLNRGKKRRIMERPDFMEPVRTPRGSFSTWSPPKQQALGGKVGGKVGRSAEEKQTKGKEVDDLLEAVIAAIQGSCASIQKDLPVSGEEEEHLSAPQKQSKDTTSQQPKEKYVMSESKEMQFLRECIEKTQQHDATISMFRNNRWDKLAIKYLEAWYIFCSMWIYVFRLE